MILPSQDQFLFKECEFSDDKCFLITPKIQGVKWTKENERFRSIIVRQSDHLVISCGFSKFVNFHELPSFQPWDYSHTPFEARHKLDGSLLIFSSYKNELIIRTRGSVDTHSMKNANEISLLKEKYPLAFDNEILNSECYSFLFEWSSPNNIIVLKEFTEPTLTLIGIVKHSSGEYVTQQRLDEIAKELKLRRPRRYEFDTILECINEVKTWQSKEGLVIFSADNQTLKKIKSERYCHLHNLASEYSSISKILEVYFLAPALYSTHKDFLSYLESISDFEISNKNLDKIQCIVDARNRVCYSTEAIREFVKTSVPSSYPTAEKAKIITERYKNSLYAKSFAFCLLHNKSPRNLLQKWISSEASESYSLMCQVKKVL